MAGEAADGRQRIFAFPSAGVTFDASFDGARLNDCAMVGENEYRAVIRPENVPINDSAWYAFRVTSEKDCAITVQLTYENGTHRFRPNTSKDGLQWTPLTASAYSKKKDSATLRLEVGPQPLWVAGAELIGTKDIDVWLNRLTRLPFATRGEVGRSLEGRPIWKLELCHEQPPKCVFITGRQHPPEVTGSIALMSFVEALAGRDELAETFRGSFKVVVVPLMNPDGVVAGNWRSNAAGVDINRDWKTFRQPETRAVRDEILQYDRDGHPRLSLLLDFHSTSRDVFYVVGPDRPTRPAGFTEEWLEALAERMPNYKVNSSIGEYHLPTARRWTYETFGIPVITCEYGYYTDRELIRRVAHNAAEEMMRCMLDSLRPTEQHDAVLSQ